MQDRSLDALCPVASFASCDAPIPDFPDKADHRICQCNELFKPRSGSPFCRGGGIASHEADGGKYKEIKKIMVQDMPCLWINEPQYIDVFSPKLEGLPDNVWGGVGHLESVWWKK